MTLYPLQKYISPTQCSPASALFAKHIHTYIHTYIHINDVKVAINKDAWKEGRKEVFI